MRRIITECDVCHKEIHKEDGDAIFQFKKRIFFFNTTYIYPHCMCEDCWDKFQEYLIEKTKSKIDIRYSNSGE